ncbi:porin family protein [Flavobacterium buctense]|uniref:Porin family protein n=2 Tax=Flavobacterium buctense TaxID=1648146 RepID=A0ABU9E323_9FLAO
MYLKYYFCVKIKNNKLMRKIIMAAIVLFGLNSIEAQVKYGLKGGLNIANLNIDEAGFPKTSAITSFHLGGFAEIMLNKKVAFQPELIYSAQGAKFDFLFDDGSGNLYDTENTFKLSYVNIPLMIKYYPQSKFFLEAGPQVGFLTSAKLKVEVVGFGSDTQGANQLFKEIDFGFNLGAGYNISKNAMVNVRYNLGLSNIAETESGDTTTINNRVFSLSVGYIF